MKACGIRTKDLLKSETADLIGINFSPISKRKINELDLREWLGEGTVPTNCVAVFKENTEEEVTEAVRNYGFRYIQLYADDFSVDFVKKIRQKVILAISIKSDRDLELAEEYAPYIDFFILDGAKPGSGESIESTIPSDFPYPFFLAGGMNAGNLDRMKKYEHCLGVDMASGIESEGKVNPEKIGEVKGKLQDL